MASKIKIISVNCQGLQDKKKRMDVLHYLSDYRPDILCLQDTHWISDDLKFVKNLWSGECLIHGIRTNARGMAILLGKNFEYKLFSIQKYNTGNFLSILLTLNDFSIRLVNTYAPNSDSPLFFQQEKC